LATDGTNEDIIVRVLGCDPKTLRKYYREELDLSHARANAAVAGSLYRKCMGDGPQSTIDVHLLVEGARRLEGSTCARAAGQHRRRRGAAHQRQRGQRVPTGEYIGPADMADIQDLIAKDPRCAVLDHPPPVAPGTPELGAENCLRRRLQQPAGVGFNAG
jgi:hypothetical protein